MLLRLLIATSLVLTLSACDQEPPPLKGEGTLRVLAGSSLIDLEGEILDEVRKNTGVTVQLSYSGTLDGVRTIMSGDAAKSYDAAWFDTSRYFELLTQGKKVVDTGTNIMSSPVIIGVRESTAKRLGWDTRQPSWGEIADAVGAKQLGFAMTNPAASNSGFCALVGMATALAGSGGTPKRPITTEQIAGVAPRLRSLFAAQELTAGSSGWLADAYIQRARDGRAIDAIVNYEAVLLSMNASGQLPERLVLVYPSDGVVVSAYPLTLLAGASAQARANYRAVSQYLLRPQIQQKILAKTHRRPANEEVKLNFSAPATAELPFPETVQVVDSLLAAYANTLRRPARTIYVLDTSGSMKGERIAGLRDALLALTGAKPLPDSKLLGFQQREQVILLPFSSGVAAAQHFDVPPDAPQPVLDKISAAVQGLTANGDTALYDALAKAYELAARSAEGDPYTTIVLLSDGERTAGLTYDQFRASHAALPEAARRTPTFAVLFGENNQAEMEALAVLTGGRAFDARTGSLAEAFADIRGYQ